MGEPNPTYKPIDPTQSNHLPRLSHIFSLNNFKNRIVNIVGSTHSNITFTWVTNITFINRFTFDFLYISLTR